MPHLFSKAEDMQSQQLLVVLGNSISICSTLHNWMYLRKYCRHMYDAFLPIYPNTTQKVDNKMLLYSLVVSLVFWM